MFQILHRLNGYLDLYYRGWQKLRTHPAGTVIKHALSFPGKTLRKTAIMGRKYAAKHRGNRTPINAGWNMMGASR